MVSTSRLVTASGAALLLAVGLGCATAKVKPTQVAPDAPLPKPPVVLIYDFAVSANDVVVDTLGAAFKGEGRELSDDEQLARDTASSLSEQLVAKLQKRGIAAERATDSTVPPLNALLLKGQFLTVDKGSRLKRMTIGFGAGSSKLEARAQVYRATERGLVRIAAAEVDASGSKIPGMAIPMAGGAALGTLATSAVISGGMNLVKEARGGMSADAGRMAEQIAKRAEAYYTRQGWL